MHSVLNLISFTERDAMKLYTYFRWWPNLYSKIYHFYEVYHEKKVAYQISAKVVKWWDKALLMAPVIFVGHQNFPNNELLVAIVNIPGIRTFHQYYLYNSTLFSVLAVILFLCSEIFANNLKSIENEKKVATCFHFVNHRYRDFVDELLIFKKKKNIWSDTVMNGQADFIVSKYAAIIYDMCRRAQRAMASIINDPECYISIKWLEATGDRDVLILNHDKSFPASEQRKNVTHLKLLRAAGTPPKTLFQVIMNKFDNPDQEPTDTWEWGIKSNDVQGHRNFDVNLPGFDNKIKSTIVLPITINSSLTGFFCFNSKKVGKLREKHKHFLSGYCDIIANLYRSMLAYSTYPVEGEDVEASS